MLPPEILELIIEELVAEDGNIDALRTCCLIARRFVHMTRKHIFYEFTVTTDELENDGYVPFTQFHSPNTDAHST